MDPNTNPLGVAPATPAPAAPPAPTPEPTIAVPVTPTPLAPEATADALSDLGNLANELNNYDPATDLAATATPAEVADPTLTAEPTLASPASDLPESAPVLQPSADLVAAATASANPNPTEDLPESAPILQPSADLAAAATVSASPNGETPSPLENIQPLAPENPTETTPVSDSINPVNGASEDEQTANASNDFNNDADLAANASEGESLKGKKVKAAAPVPGSIGSMKSYADIQREEAERAAKAAALEAAKKNGKKPMNTTTILIAAAAAIVAIIVVVVMIFSFNSGDDGSVAGGGGDTPPEPVEAKASTLICSIPMRPEEFAGMPGVLSAKRVNTFGFTDDELSSLKTEQIYYMDSAQSATNAKLGYDSEHPEVKNSGQLEEPETDDDDEDDEDEDEEEEPEVNMNDRYSMENITTTAKGATYTFTRYVSEELIGSWMESKFYSDVEYGLTIKNPNAPEESRTIDGYKAAQNSLNYTCTVTEQ